jgi:hypothetical protein
VIGALNAAAAHLGDETLLLAGGGTPHQPDPDVYIAPVYDPGPGTN